VLQCQVLICSDECILVQVNLGRISRTDVQSYVGWSVEQRSLQSGIRPTSTIYTEVSGLAGGILILDKISGRAVHKTTVNRVLVTNRSARTARIRQSDG